jgi:BRCT domain type II-containing protein
MVFTGEMDQITRHEAEEKAKAAGAKVPGQTDMDRYRQMSLEILDR